MIEEPSVKPLIYLIHIQKTAGTTLRVFFSRGFGRNRCLFSGRDAKLPAIAASNPSRFQKCRVIGGHVGFGKIPQVIMDRSPVFVSVVRDPVARVISHYHYIRSKPGNGLHNLLEHKTLYQALQTRRFVNLVDRMQIELLCGEKDIRVLNKTMRRNRFIVGKQEYMQELFDYLSTIFGIETYSDVRKNVGSAGYEADIGAQPDYNEAIKIIQELNIDEYKFYNSFGPLWSNL